MPRPVRSWQLPTLVHMQQHRSAELLSVRSGGETLVRASPTIHCPMLIAAATLLELVHLSNAALQGVVTPSPQNETCRSPLDCCGSPCSGGVCTCDPGYTGGSCCALALSECSIAVNPNETWTWGAAPRWTAAGTVELMAMGLRNRCGINNCAAGCHPP